ncbi:protein ENDOSPERM DEFECTIVE 1-like protein [Carex littledalei]|uniref:Protein ENDOSPERM DEFECTIVE 1-like protein n=1 Tax=Carex littledalei TaxID=544730 RepID=A0A833VH27_9POAL|nr:protein ENDOSPERM DEFECTIVE 1-like protein [Carex littledalei]
MATSANPPLPPTPQPPPPSTVARRARRGFREVSSRYLSTPLHPSPSPRPGANPSPRRTPSRSGSEYGSESESEWTDENRRPTPLHQSRSVNGTFYFTSEARPPNNRVVHKLFVEKSDAESRPPEDSRRRPRPGTPSFSPKTRNPVRPKRAPASPRPARPEDDCGSDVETCSVDSCSSGTQSGSFCNSPPITGTNMRNRAGAATDLRSSLSRVESSCRVSNPLVCRSLNSSLSGSQTTGFENDKTMGMETRRVVSGKPPQRPVLGLEVKKLKKGKRAEEEAHSLKLLNNRLIQLKFMNAEAGASTKTKMLGMEKELYGASIGISELRDRVNEKRIQLDCLKREMKLSSILESQMAYLDDWDTVERDQDESLSGVITALQNASVRVPVGSDVKADAIEIKEALSRAIKALEPSSSCLQKFVPMAEEVEKIALDLAKVTTKERESIEECGNLLAVAHNLQVKESSLRSTLIQLKQHSLQAQECENF